MAGRLNDNEVAAEMNKMVSFIKQEALEKAREIKVKADEEFNIEKAKLVRQETIAIEAFYQKKIKQAEVSRKIAHSNHVNKNRLRVLQARQQILDELFEETRSKLVSISSDAAKYQSLLKDLLLQAFYQLMEPGILVQCRKQDVAIVQAASEEAKAVYAKALGTQIKVEISSTNFLPESSGGGVVVSSTDGRIRVSNTLVSRLEILGDTMLPDIRILLFGPSPPDPSTTRSIEHCMCYVLFFSFKYIFVYVSLTLS
ncbi:ATP synthase subunit-domain-containing protein [Chytridium lagenaria]|nr:ATP synthase subunit-domain-containing protein [Chytridium lagenaria]